MKIAAYIRVSTSVQTGAGQRREISRWLRVHGHDPMTVTWFEDQETGQHLDRSGLQALNATIFNGEVDTVIIWKLDRLARSLRDGINTLCDWVDGGVRVVSVTQQMDLSGTTGKIVASVLLGLSEIELPTSGSGSAPVSMPQNCGVLTRAGRRARSRPSRRGPSASKRKDCAPRR